MGLLFRWLGASQNNFSIAVNHLSVELVVLDCSRVEAGKERGSGVAGVHTVDKSGEYPLFTETRVDCC